MTNNSWFPKILLGAYVVVFALLAINPFSREVWVAENIPIVLIVCTWCFCIGGGFSFLTLVTLLCRSSYLCIPWVGTLRLNGYRLIGLMTSLVLSAICMTESHTSRLDFMPIL